MSIPSLSIPDFANAQLALLRAELDAETAQQTAMLETAAPKTLARAGLAILNLMVLSQRTGLGGKTVIEVGPDPATSTVAGEMGEHGIRAGDIVRVAPQPKGGERKKEKSVLEGKGSDGVVVRTTKANVQVALDEENDLEGRLWIVKLANEVTYRRMNQVMEKMAKLPESEYTTLMRILFGLEKPAPVSLIFNGPESESERIDFFDPTLNDSQKEAVRFALASREVALIHGPPGTGKTYTLIELIRQLLKQDLRVLVCGPSNISVDNIVERLAPHKVPLVRIGHPARLLPSIISHSLDVLTQTSEAASLVKDIRKEMDEKQASIRKTRNGRERHQIYGEIKELRKDFRTREQNCIDTIVSQSKVVLSTLHGAGSSQTRKAHYDVVIIDEASQALEAQSWVALLNAKKVILAGDHLQLPPTVKSLNEKSKKTKSKDQSIDTKGLTLEMTMFDRLLALLGPSIKRMLTVQYRMHETIMEYPSRELYEGKLEAAEEVRTRLLCDLDYAVDESEDTKEPLIFFDTQGDGFLEKLDVDESEKASKSSLLGDSKCNEGEAALVKMHVGNLINAGVHAEDIAVVTPYNAQLALISKDLKQKFTGIELGSVDGFQGREKEVVIVSLVRSNAEREVGFLGEKRRLNVAMTRPKRQLCVIGDSETLARGSAFLKHWMTFLEEHADLRYPDPVDIQ